MVAGYPKIKGFVNKWKTERYCQQKQNAMFFCNFIQPEEVKAEIEDKEELAKNRLVELEKLQESYAKLSEDYEKLRLQVSQCIVFFSLLPKQLMFKMLKKSYDLKTVILDIGDF